MHSANPHQDKGKHPGSVFAAQIDGMVDALNDHLKVSAKKGLRGPFALAFTVTANHLTYLGYRTDRSTGATLSYYSTIYSTIVMAYVGEPPRFAENDGKRLTREQSR